MSQDACPLPGSGNDAQSQLISRLLLAQRIAVVGLSPDPVRTSYAVAEYLQKHGKQVIPINPTIATWNGLRCYPTLESAPGPIDLVNVFRRAEFCPDVVRSAIKVGARAIWLQSGIRNEVARKLAEEAGLKFIQDRCFMVEHLHAR